MSVGIEPLTLKFQHTLKIMSNMGSQKETLLFGTDLTFSTWSAHSHSPVTVVLQLTSGPLGDCRRQPIESHTKTQLQVLCCDLTMNDLQFCALKKISAKKSKITNIIHYINNLKGSKVKFTEFKCLQGLPLNNLNPHSINEFSWCKNVLMGMCRYLELLPNQFRFMAIIQRFIHLENRIQARVSGMESLRVQTPLLLVL